MSNCQVIKVANGYKILGIMNFDSVAQLFKQGLQLLEEHEKIEVDFEQVTHADSSAIALLLSWIRLANQKGKAIVFTNLPSQLLEMATVCEVDLFLNQYLKSYN